MTNPELSQVGIIERTLRVVDPLRSTVVVGTGGMALHFAEAGREVPDGVPDLDLVASAADVYSMQERLARDPLILSVELNQGRDEYNIPVGEAKLDIKPRAGRSLLPVNLFTGIKDNKYSISAGEALGESVTVHGERTLPLDVLLTWKIMAGREKDVRAGQILTDLAASNKLLTPAAVRSLRCLLELRRQIARKQ